MAASSRGLRSFWGKSWLGATDVIAVNAPPARLETKSGVIVPLAAPVVSMVLAQVSTTEPTSWFTGESRLLCARMKNG